MEPNPEGGAQLWGEGPAGNEMPNMEDDGRGEDGEESAQNTLSFEWEGKNIEALTSGFVLHTEDFWCPPKRF